jgi:hypothetical protein
MWSFWTMAAAGIFTVQNSSAKHFAKQIHHMWDPLLSSKTIPSFLHKTRAVLQTLRQHGLFWTMAIGSITHVQLEQLLPNVPRPLGLGPGAYQPGVREIFTYRCAIISDN